MSQVVFFAALLALLGVAFAASMLWQRSRALAIALSVGVVACAAGYVYLSRDATAPRPPSLTDAVAQLESKVAQDPRDVGSLVLLARAYVATQKFELARDTYAQAVKLKPEDTDLSVEYVAALMRASQDQQFPPFAVALLEKAIAKNPDNQQALFFLGLHQMQTRQWAEAAATLGSMSAVLEPNAARDLRLQLGVARMRAGLPPLPAAALSLEIDIAPALAGQVGKGMVLFVYARALSPGAPLVAVKRINVDRLPMVVQLDDEDSPLPTEGLSAQFKVAVQARLSRSGDAQEKRGDLKSVSMEVATTRTQPLALVLDRQVP